MAEQSEIPANKTEKPTFEHTIFKSSYYLGEHLLSLYVNFGRVAPDVFSFVIKKGKWNTIYNLTDKEKVSFAKKVFACLTPEEKKQLLEE